jgi:hypothetical protein
MIDEMTKFEQEIRGVYATISPPTPPTHWTPLGDPRTSVRAQGPALAGTRRTIRIEDAYRRRRPLRTGAALVIALLLIGLGNLAGAYYVPRYGQALAQVPLVGGIYAKALQYYGLAEQNVTVVNGSSTSSGHTVRLVAGYADGLRTLLVVEIDGKALTYGKTSHPNPGEFGVGNHGETPDLGVTLTDQFGHSYKEGAGNGYTNYLQFQPLVWPASKVGARLTLHITTLTKLWLEGAGQDEVSGDWTLHATLVAEPVHVLPLPSPVRTTNAVYTFTSLRVTSTAVHIEWTATGALIDDPRLANHGSQAADQLTTDYFLPRLFDAAGHETQDSTSGITLSRPVKIEFNGYVSGPGRYRLQLGDALTGHAYEVWIVVP